MREGNASPLGWIDRTAVFGAAIVLAVAVLSWVALDRIEERTRGDVESSLQTVLGTTHAGTLGWAQDRRDHVGHMLVHAEIRDPIRALARESVPPEALRTSPDLAALREALAPHLAQEGDLAFWVVRPDGRNLASSRDADLLEENVLAGAAPDALERVFAGASQWIRPLRLATGEPACFVAAPVADEAGTISAAFVLAIDPARRFTRIIQLARTGETGDTYAFDHNGVMLTEGRFPDQLREVGLLRATGREILSVTLYDPGVDLLAGERPAGPRGELALTRMAAAATAGQDGVDARGYRDYRGVRVVGAWLWDEELGIGMAAEVDVAEAYASYRETRRTIVSVLTVIVLLFFGYSTALYLRTRELREALSSIRTLRGLLPICSSCKKIRDDRGLWNQIEAYVAHHSEAEFSHGICPQCVERHHPDLWEELEAEKAEAASGHQALPGDEG